MRWIKFVKSLIANLSLVILSIVLVLGVFEIILRAGVLDGLDSLAWIAPHHSKKNDEIYQYNHELSKLNPFSFTDFVRTRERNNKSLRIAILGDSFVWGDGIEYQKTWSHKLEKKLKEDFPSSEILHWGKNGWNTSDQFEFYKMFGRTFDVDIVLFGFVVNDTDMNNTKRNPNDEKSHIMSYKGAIDSYVFDFLIVQADKILLKMADHYDWFDELYSEKNLTEYSNLLTEVKEYFQKNNTPFAFIMTPRGPYQPISDYYEKITPLFDKNGISYYNLFPETYREFSHNTPRELWANPANGHPGEPLTTFYSDHVMIYLNNNFHDVLTNKTHGRKNPSKHSPGNWKMRRKSINHPIYIRIGMQTVESDKYKIEKQNISEKTYIKVSARDNNNNNFQKCIIRINNNYYPTFKGSFYDIVKHIPNKSKYVKSRSSEYMFSAHVPSFDLKQKTHELEVILFDYEGYTTSRRVNISLTDPTYTDLK